MSRYLRATDHIELVKVAAAAHFVCIATQVEGGIFRATDLIDFAAQHRAAIDETFASTLGQILTAFDSTADALVAIGRHTRDFGFVAFRFCCKRTLEGDIG